MGYASHQFRHSINLQLKHDDNGIPMSSRKLLMKVCTSLLVLPGYAAATLDVSPPSSGNEWYTAKDPVIIKTNIATHEPTTNFRIFFGHTDLSALFIETTPGTYKRANFQVNLPSGAQEIIIYNITKDDDWNEIGRQSVNILTPTGFQSVEVTPRLNITNKSQWDEGHSEDAFPPERETYHDLNMEGGLNISAERGQFTMNVDANIIGASHRQETLRYSERLEEAPKIDLSDYLAEFNYANASLSVGHVSSGNNPLLLDQFNTRGLLAKYNLNPIFDIAISTQNGSEIVGYNRLFGIKEKKHQINSATLGIELLPQMPGELRAEVSYLDASVLADPGFDTGAIPDAEKSDGYGLRLISNALEGRLRTDLSYARSSYTNPPDPFLAFEDEEVVDVEETTNSARRVDITADIIQELAITDNTSLNLSIQYTHERISPEYKTLGAFPNSDQLTNSYGLMGNIGDISTALTHSVNEDNLDNIPTVLKTRTRTTTTNLDIPLQQIINPDRATQIWPTLSFNNELSHQKAANRPIEEFSDFNSASHLPDQVTDNKMVSVSWAWETWDLAFNHARSFQDNRQNGRELADFTTINQEISINLRPNYDFNISLTYGQAENRDRENDLISYDDTSNIAINWSISEQWSLAANFSAGKSDDSEGNAERKSNAHDVQLSHQFQLPLSGKKLPGQFFVRYAKQQEKSTDNLFDLNTNAETWTFNSGLSISLF